MRRRFRLNVALMSAERAPWDALGPPPVGLFLREQARALGELAQVRARRRALARAPRGDGHPVYVLPGFLASDLSTVPLRRFLCALGYDAHGWDNGRNLGPDARLRSEMRWTLASLCTRTGRRVSLVGWSLGGIYARELARAHPEQVRGVITLGTPFADVSATHAARIYRDREGRSAREASALRARLRSPVPVPTTSIYSRTDGVCNWRSCLEVEGGERENVEVRCSHIGMGFHPDVLEIVADRLALPEGRWAPYRAGSGAD